MRRTALLAGACLALLAASPSRAGPPGVVIGRALDGGAGLPLAGVRIELEGAGVTATDESGVFVFRSVAAGVRHLHAHRTGFRLLERTLTVVPGETLRVELRLVGEPVPIGGIEVRGARPGGAGIEGQRPVDLSGRGLRQALGRTIAETLDREPGIDQRTLGPAPARPVLRGFSGSRLLVLEDGERSGDLSHTAADHAVVIEPMQSSGVEVMRGPGAFTYGSNALAGVVNVQRGVVPERRPDRLHCALTFQGESVNRGTAWGLALQAPLGPLALRGDGTLRVAGDLRTPVGPMTNTSLDTGSGALGASWVGRVGHLGGGFSRYVSDYGVPGGFLGGHPNGVDIELERSAAEASGAAALAVGPFTRFEAHGGQTRYYHRELESSGACGVSFGVLTYNGGARAHWGGGPAGRGQLGFWGEYRDYATGCLSFVPATLERAAAVFAYHEWRRATFGASASLRWDRRAVEPGESGANKAGALRPRTFDGFSGGLALNWDPQPHWTFGASVLQAFNPPGVEELFSDGPHLAAYSYEVGNADLEAERGTGLELSAAHHASGHRVTTALFYNRFPNFIQAVDTGELEYGAGEEGALSRYQYAGVPAHLLGGECGAEVALGSAWSIEGALSAVYGERSDTGQPLDAMPPVTGRLALRARAGMLAGAAVLRGAAAQERVGEFEAPTAAWLVADLQAEWTFARPGWSHHLVATLENLADTEYRRHLSRVRSVMPEAGVNLKLLYRLAF